MREPKAVINILKFYPELPMGEYWKKKTKTRVPRYLPVIPQF